VLHICSATIPEIVSNHSAILRVSSLVSPKLAEEAPRPSTNLGTVYKRVAVDPKCTTLFRPADPRGGSCGGD
jgi:hypothetical protein